MSEGTKIAWSSEGDPEREPSRPPPPTPSTGPARVRIERQGRGGKVVTIVENLTGHPARLEELAKTLKARCGAGGTVKGRVIEVQGDHRDRIVATLIALEVAARRIG